MAGGVEEDEVEREAHAKGVDARAARDQQPGPRLVAIEMGKAEQAGTAPHGDRDLATENGRRGQVAKTAAHVRSRPQRPNLSPPPPPR